MKLDPNMHCDFECSVCFRSFDDQTSRVTFYSEKTFRIAPVQICTECWSRWEAMESYRKVLETQSKELVMLERFIMNRTFDLMKDQQFTFVATPRRER